MKTETLQITELFTSIQGESTYIGHPCFFIRLAECNLNCSYCDTKYSFDKDSAEELTINKIVELAKISGVKLVEITGGEPLLQKNVLKLCTELINNKFKVLMETNGSLSISKIHPKVIKILDCKCPSSNESDKMLSSNYGILTSNDEIKFVLTDLKDYNYAKQVINNYNLFKITDKILFSPITTNLNPQLLAEWMIKDKIPAILQLQLHKIIWPGVDKGV